MKPVWNVPYAPDLNAIEYVFSMLKRNFKKAKLNTMMNDLNSNTEELIEAAWKQIQKEILMNCVYHAYSQIKS